MPSPVKRAARQAPLIGPLILSDPVQYMVRTVRAARGVREHIRFTVLQLVPARTGSYTLASSGLRVFLRHRTRDIDIFKEVFGTGYGPGCYDPPAEIAAALDASEEPGVLDLGGNIGLFGTYVLGRWPGARIRSFEPDPTNLPVIERVIAANQLQRRWIVEPAAVSNADGELPFVSGLYAESQLAGVERARVRDPHAASLESGRLVNVPVADLFHRDTAVDLIKMDIEGGEWSILTDPRLPELGARAVVLEWHTDGAPEDDARAAAIRLLAGAGYTQLQETEDHGTTGILWAWRPAPA